MIEQEVTEAKIRFMIHSRSYHYNALQSHPQKLVQITSNNYAAEL